MAEYDGLVLPGGVANPDFLRMVDPAVRFVRGFFEAGKPVAAICHGPWILVEADVVRGDRDLVAEPQTDLRNAGADLGRRGGRTSTTASSPAASRTTWPPSAPSSIEEFAEGEHEGQRAATASASASR